MGWVLTIAHRRAVDRVRAAQAGADRERRVAAASVDTPYDDVVEGVTASLEQQQVRRCLQGLTDLQREAITLAYYDGYSYREVAEKLETALLAEVARTRQVGPDNPAGMARRTAAGAWPRRLVAAVAAAIVLLAGAGTVWVQQQRLDDARRLTQTLQEAQAPTGRILAAGDTRLHRVSVDGGTVTVALSEELNDGVVLVTDLPAPPEGRVYQVWRIADGEPTSVGVFVEGQRSGLVAMGTLGGADNVGVTLEPPGGLPTPTLPLVATVILP